MESCAKCTGGFYTWEPQAGAAPVLIGGGGDVGRSAVLGPSGLRFPGDVSDLHHLVQVWQEVQRTSGSETNSAHLRSRGNHQ